MSAFEKISIYNFIENYKFNRFLQFVSRFYYSHSQQSVWISRGINAKNEVSVLMHF